MTTHGREAREPERSSAGERAGFRSTSAAGIDRSSLPMRLWEKSKRLGTWDPATVDLARDAEDWTGLDEEQRDVLMRLAAQFLAGEEAVTVDLLPLIRTVAFEGRLEEEIFLTAFLFEEAKHVDAFRRFFEEVSGEPGDMSRYHTESYRRIFHRELPAALARLEEDPSPEAQADASTTYNLVVEGVLAETGYHAYAAMLERNGIMPGMQEILVRVKQDESRHLAYGVHLLSRLVAEHGDRAWRVIEGRMDELLPPAIGIIHETFDAYGDPMPFGLELDEFVEFATAQFGKRLDRVEAAREKSLAEVLRA